PIATPQPPRAPSPLPSAPPAGRAARRAAAAVVAEQFMSELARSIRSRPTPLPTPFRPMAEAITGSDRVLLSTDAGSRRALRSVGKRAATTGNVIHLDRTPTPGRAINEVIAHELTHVAHPSPTPRFFDDIDDSPEERRAETVARVMASSPLAPTPGVIAPVLPAGADIVRRSPAKEGAQMATADAMARQLTGMPPTSGRTPATTGATTDTATGADTIRRLASGPSSTSSTASAETSAPERAIPLSRSGGVQLGSEAASDWFREELE